MARYQAPDWFTSRVANPVVALLTKRLGVSVWGSRVLAVRGRQSGAWRSTPVNVLTFQGQRYLVAARGETQWVRNIRAGGGGELHLGSRVEPIRVTELGAHEKVPVLRAYLRRWRWEVGRFFAVSDPDATDEDLRRIAPDHPIFRISS